MALNDNHEWRSLAEKQGGEGEAPSELPADTDEPWEWTLGRREWLELLGGGIALAGLSACVRDPTEKILPYTIQPPEAVPGTTQHYATSMVLGGYAMGLVVESHEGRPTKIEGNPEHPASLGATGPLEQASLLGLYDPNRARSLRGQGDIATWDAFVARFSKPRTDGGAGLRFVLERTSSPLVARLVERVRARYPAARFAFQSARGPNEEDGARLAWGAPLEPRYDLSKARVILSLDADFASSSPDSVALSRQFANGRRVTEPTASMNRLYVVEPALTPTGTLADHRLRRRAGDIARLAAAIAADVIVVQGKRPPRAPASLNGALARLTASTEDARFVRAVARDLVLAGSEAVILVGHRQPPEVHAIAHLLNAALGSEGAWAIDSVVPSIGEGEDLTRLAADLRANRVDTLVVLEGNPAYTAPSDLELSELLSSPRTVVHLTLYENETSRAATWIVPGAHYLEAWGDARGPDGTLSLVQPLIAPLFGGKTVAEVLAVFAGETHPSAYDQLRTEWFAANSGGELAWEDALRRGLVKDSASPRAEATLDADAIAGALVRLASTPPPATVAMEIAFALDSKVYDGRFTNNPWLLELPEPISKLCWGNAALVSPATAARLGLEDGDVVALALEGRTQRAPILIAPGHAEDAITVHLGYGRNGAEVVARDVGFDAGPLRTTKAPWFARGVTLKKVGATEALARTQRHWDMRGRDIAKTVNAIDYAKFPNFAAESRGPLPSLLRPKAEPGEQWAMSIDLGVCTGCSACVVACQAENNTPVVGKKQVEKSREMHWLRIDTYYRGPESDPEPINQPMLCQHCEKAPCEYVCPVNATVHSADGLNEMVYNRCVGTRFCSNNCPYKVRRFNWFNWRDQVPENRGLIKLQRNPNVSVRDRGVMEKCSYCVQRIRSAEINARVEGRAIGDAEVTPACAQACPTRAITFGSLTHPSSEVVARRAEPRSYSVLHETGAMPRTQYLARVRNPNPELE